MTRIEPPQRDPELERVVQLIDSYAPAGADDPAYDRMRDVELRDLAVGVVDFERRSGRALSLSTLYEIMSGPTQETQRDLIAEGFPEELVVRLAGFGAHEQELAVTSPDLTQEPHPDTALMRSATSRHRIRRWIAAISVVVGAPAVGLSETYLPDTAVPIHATEEALGIVGGVIAVRETARRSRGASDRVSMMGRTEPLSLVRYRYLVEPVVPILPVSFEFEEPPPGISPLRYELLPGGTISISIQFQHPLVLPSPFTVKPEPSVS